MNNNTQIKIYIDSSKPYYYPGEQILASILLDVLEEVNCNKMLIVAKGKQIIKASQLKMIQTENIDNDEEEEFENDNEDNIKRDSEDSSYNYKNERIELNESKTIFKYKKTVKISKNEYISEGKYTFPLEVELAKDIPPSFLFLEPNIYVEIIYSIKVKLNNSDIKQYIPIVIRQKEDIFNYPNTNEYIKNINGCCCEVSESKIKVKTNEKYILDEKELKLNVLIDNSKCSLSGSPINIEIYHELILYPKNRNKQIKMTKIVGKYKGKKLIDPRKDYNKNISIPLDISKFTSEHLSQTKSIKYFKHKDLIPLMGQCIKTNSIICKYEIYAESQFSNLSGDELGVFIFALVYPPEKGILSKNVKNITKEFTNSILNKKIFLNSNTIDNDSDFEINKKNDKNNKHTKNKDIKRDYNNENKNNPEMIKSQTKESSLNSKKIDKKEEKEYNKENNNIKINEKKNEPNIYNNSNNFIKDEISFGTSSKGKINNINSNNISSNNIKKNFNQNFLDDALDDEFIDNDTIK